MALKQNTTKTKNVNNNYKGDRRKTRHKTQTNGRILHRLPAGAQT